MRRFIKFAIVVLALFLVIVGGREVYLSVKEDGAYKSLKKAKKSVEEMEAEILDFARKKKAEDARKAEGK